MGGKRIGLREIRALGENETIWDSAVSGFGARRQNGNAIAYILKYRTAEGRQRWYTIGRHGAPYTPDTARAEAVRLLGDVARKGDPAAEKIATRKAATVGELCDLYLADAEAGRLLTRRKAAKKPSTLATDRGRIERHIKPQLGRLAVASVTREDADAFMHAIAEGKTAARIKTAKKRGLARVRGGKGTASRTVGLLGAIFSYAVRHRMRSDNPVHGVTRFADGHRERRLSDTEYKALGGALKAAEAEAIWPAALSASRFLALTGWRSGEALGLRWEELDLARRTATLGDTKTGRSARPLSHAACDVLRNVMKAREAKDANAEAGAKNTGKAKRHHKSTAETATGRSAASAFVFPPTRGDGRMSGFPKLWARIAKLGKLPSDVTPHVLRHSFASLAADLGYSEPTIASLVGHKGHSITSRYVHSADAVLLAAADAVADRTAALMGEAKKGVVVELRQAAG
jgi:integrase